MHKLQGKIFFWLALLHSVAHIIRWGVRGELGTLSQTMFSGYFAMFFMFTAVLSMTVARRWKKQMSFERRLAFC